MRSAMGRALLSRRRPAVLGRATNRVHAKLAAGRFFCQYPRSYRRPEQGMDSQSVSSSRGLYEGAYRLPRKTFFEARACLREKLLGPQGSEARHRPCALLAMVVPQRQIYLPDPRSVRRVRLVSKVAQLVQDVAARAGVHGIPVRRPLERTGHGFLDES